MTQRQTRRVILEERATRAMTEWFAATDPYVSDLARRRYRRAQQSLKREYVVDA